MRDLPDIALLATTGPIDARRLRQAIEKTFAFRSTHPVPAGVPAPPDFWEAPYATMAATDELPWPTLSGLAEAVSSFLDPILRSIEVYRWEPVEWRWRE